MYSLDQSLRYTNCIMKETLPQDHLETVCIDNKIFNYLINILKFDFRFSTE